MLKLQDKTVLVLGLDSHGLAACELMRRAGAKVIGLDPADTAELRAETVPLRSLGVEVSLGAKELPDRPFDQGVLSPALAAHSELVLAARERKLPLATELEFGAQYAHCLALAIAGTNGKATTANLVERMLAHNGRKTLVAGDASRPICSVIEQTKHLDFLILQTHAFQLESSQLFRPSVAVLLNLAPAHAGRYPDPEAYVRAHGRLFQNQQPFDWAIVQSEALARLRQLQVPVPAKTITFSATDPQADLYLDRGLLISRLPNWSGPLLDLDHCQLRGPHNAENLMAALALGHVLRLPLEAMVDPLKTCPAEPHRFELVATINGVQFIDDSEAANLDALHKALLATRPGPQGQPNVCLIAGGDDQNPEYYEIGPVLSRRVKGVFLLGEAREKIRAAWSLFTPCTAVGSLLEAVSEAAKIAAPGDVVLLSPACSSSDQFRNYQTQGESFCQAVQSICGGGLAGHPNRLDKTGSAETAQPNQQKHL